MWLTFFPPEVFNILFYYVFFMVYPWYATGILILCTSCFSGFLNLIGMFLFYLGKYSSMIMLSIWSMLLTWNFSLTSMTIIQKFGVFTISYILCAFLSYFNYLLYSFCYKFYNFWFAKFILFVIYFHFSF